MVSQVKYLFPTLDGFQLCPTRRPNGIPELICQTPVEVFLNPSGKFTRMRISFMKERFPTLDGFQLCPTVALILTRHLPVAGPDWEKGVFSGLAAQIPCQNLFIKLW
jgi:hypothetical protein